jgi:hypothetical protein
LILASIALFSDFLSLSRGSISPAEYQQIFANEFIKAQLLDIDLLLANGNKPKFTTSWDDGLNWETTESNAKGDLKRVRKFLGNHIEAVAYVKNTEGGGTGVLLEFKARRNVARRLLINHAKLVGDGLEALRFLTDQGFDKQLRERVQAIAGKLSQQFKDTAISRVAIRFALVQVGLELAHSFGLLPFPVEQCGWAVKQMFDAWVSIRGGAGSIEIKEAFHERGEDMGIVESIEGE